MSDDPSPQPEVYGRLTGKKRVAIVLLGAVSGAAVAFLFASFSGNPAPTGEVIIGTVGGALLGLSASLGEVRRKKSPPDQTPLTPHDK